MMSEKETVNIEWEAAKIIHDSWDILINDFLSLTARGKEKFENKQFKELFGLAITRFKLYSVMTQQANDQIEQILGDKLYDTRVWEKIKHYYFHLIQNRYDKPNTETFYNSVSRKIFNQIRIGFSQQFEFFENEDYHVVEFTDPKVFREIPVSRLNEQVLKNLLLSLDFNIEWEDIDRDCEEIMNKLAPIIVFQKNNLFLDSIEIVNTIFYRNRGAFVLGKLRYRRWTMPFAIALLNEKNGLFVDAFIPFMVGSPCNVDNNRLFSNSLPAIMLSGARTNPFAPIDHSSQNSSAVIIPSNGYVPIPSWAASQRETESALSSHCSKFDES